MLRAERRHQSLRPCNRNMAVDQKEQNGLRVEGQPTRVNRALGLIHSHMAWSKRLPRWTCSDHSAIYPGLFCVRFKMDTIIAQYVLYRYCSFLGPKESNSDSSLPRTLSAKIVAYSFGKRFPQTESASFTEIRVLLSAAVFAFHYL